MYRHISSSYIISYYILSYHIISYYIFIIYIYLSIHDILWVFAASQAFFGAPGLPWLHGRRPGPGGASARQQRRRGGGGDVAVAAVWRSRDGEVEGTNIW